MPKQNEIKLGIQKGETTNFENLICSYCKNVVIGMSFMAMLTHTILYQQTVK